MARTWIEKVAGDLYVLRVDDDESRYFESLWSIPEGITYNAYVLTTSEGAVVFDGWRKRYADLFIESLQRVVDLNSVRAVVVHHMEPDHSGSIPRLLQRIGRRVAVYAHPLALSMMRAFYGVELEPHPVRDLESLSFGDYTVKFIYTPWLHWPETIMSYVVELKALLSCDAFGSFSIPQTLFDEGIDLDSYMEYVRKYIVTVIGHYIEYVAKNIDKVTSLDIDIEIVAPSHGIVWRREPTRVIDYYYRASRGELLNPRKVTIVYSSMYGFLHDLMSRVEKKLASEGYLVKKHAFLSTSQPSIGDALSDIFDSSAVILGLSTYEASIFPAMKYLLDLFREKIRFRKRVAAVISYGWGSPRRVVESILQSMNVDVLGILEVRGRAADEVVDEVVALVKKGGLLGYA